MPLTIQQKSSLRRHLGFPVVGLPVLNPAGGSLYDGSVGYRWNQAYAFLEWKMNTLNPDEESRVTGYAYGATLLQGNTQTGDAVTLVVSGGPLSSAQTISYTATSADNALSMAMALAALANQNAALLAGGFFAVAPYGTGPFNERPGLNPLSEMAIVNPQTFAFTASSTGATSAAVTSGGQRLHPRAVLSDPISTRPMVIHGYLPILDALETASVGASDDLSTLKADVWTARQDEVAQREGLYHAWRERLSKFLDVQLWEDTPGAQRASAGLTSVL